MNPRLEIASRLLAGQYDDECTIYSNVKDCVAIADALIKECGDQPDDNFAERRVLEEIHKRMDAENELSSLRTDCQKLVEEWRKPTNGQLRASDDLEAVLNGGSK